MRHFVVTDKDTFQDQFTQVIIIPIETTTGELQYLKENIFKSILLILDIQIAEIYIQIVPEIFWKCMVEKVLTMLHQKNIMEMFDLLHSIQMEDIYIPIFDLIHLL